MNGSEDFSESSLSSHSIRRLLDATGVATIWLTAELRLISYSAGATEIYDLRPEMIGRPLAQLDHFALKMPSLPSSASAEASRTAADSESVDRASFSDTDQRDTDQRDTDQRDTDSSAEEIVLSDNRWFHRHVVRMQDSSGQAGWLVSFRDITAMRIAEIRQRAEHRVAELLASASTIEEIAEEVLSVVRESLHAPVGIVWFLESGKLRCRFGSVSPGQPSGKRFIEASEDFVFALGEGLPGKVAADRDAMWVEDITKRSWFPRGPIAADCGFEVGIAVPIVSGDECLGVLEFYSSLTMRRDPELSSMLRSIGHQIGTFIRRCQSDQSLRSEALRNREILRNALDAIITMDVEGRIVNFNPAAVETFGWTEEEVQGRLLSDTIIPAEYREAHRIALQRYVDTGQATILGKRIELIALRKNGEHFPVELSIGVGQNMDGTPFFTGYIRDIGERRSQEMQLRRSEAFLRRTLDSLYAFVFVCTPAGEVIQVNDAALEVAGLQHDDVLNRRFWETYWWSYDQGVQQRLRDAVKIAAEGDRARFDVDIRVGQDELMTIDSQLVPMRDDEGQVTHLIFSGTNISERKRLEEDLIDKQAQLLDVLKESEADKAKLRTIFDETSFYVSAIDLRGRLVEVNRTSLEACGYEREEVIERPYWETRWWSGSYTVQNRIREALDAVFEGASFRDELAYWMSDGEQRIVDLSLAPVRNERGKVIMAIATGADITDQKRAQQREQRESERQRFIGEVGAALSSSLDYEKTLKRVVDHCVPTIADWAFLDLLDEDGIARRVAVTHHDPNDRELAAKVASYAAHPAFGENPPARGLFGAEGVLVPDFTEEMIRKSAQNAEHESVIRAVRARSLVVVPLVARGTVFGALTLIATRRRPPYDEEDLRIAEELAGRSAMAIDNARLYERGQQANRAKSEFIANMSHEIRTPLTAVLGYADLLLGSEDDPQKTKFLETIRRNGKFLLEILNDILDFSKIESGKLEVDHERFDLTTVVADVYGMMAPQADAKDLEFTVKYESELPEYIDSDPKRLRQILMNLIGNAIKFTERGRIDLSIRELQQTEGSLIEFRVQDTGIGIAEEQLSRLFKPFGQGDSSVTRRFGGTGLGLAISQQLASLLDGEVSVESVLSQGSTFTVTIASGVEQSTIRRKVDLLQDTIQERDTTRFQVELNCHILVVDDRRDVRFLAGYILKRNGATVNFCEDGVEACAYVKRQLNEGVLPDLILLDMQMPRMDGYQTAMKLREMGYRKAIIALTADAMHGDMRRCIVSGCDDYLSKPIDTTRLLQMVFKMTSSSLPHSDRP